MAQIKVYGVSKYLSPIRETLSNIIHHSIVEAMGLPENKQAHRFFPLDESNFIMPNGRSHAYTIIEINMMTGHGPETKKKLVKLLFENIKRDLGILEQDVEICISESPPHNWGVRGYCGDEVHLSYKVEV